jgi:ABC-type branched-subunit amino acid transport system ATPase component
LDSILTRFPRLKERYSQAAGTLSGGEQQMMVIGAQLMAKAEAVVAGRTQPRDRAQMVQDIARSSLPINRTKGVSVLLVEQELTRWRSAFRIVPTPWRPETLSSKGTPKTYCMMTGSRLPTLAVRFDLT